MLNATTVHDSGETRRANAAEKLVNASVLTGNSSMVVLDRCKWTAEPIVESGLCKLKEQEKVERKTSKVLDESKKMQYFSLFRGFPQACQKIKK